jgi:hypothetical protein
MKNFKNVRVLLGVSICLFFIGCANVKPYQRAYLNHSEMETGDDLLDGYETNVQNYREGASGGTGGKTGGGCGCN